MRWVQTKDGDAIALSAGGAGTVIARRNKDRWTVIVAKGNTTELLVEDASLELANGIAEDYVRRSEACGLAEKGARWRAESATKKQIELLNKMKVKTAGELTCGEASDMITQAIAEDWRYMPATPKQVGALRARGIGIKPGLTRQEARRMLWAGR